MRNKITVALASLGIVGALGLTATPAVMSTVSTTIGSVPTMYYHD